MTDTYNPIQSKKEYKSTIRIFEERPKPKAHTALVFVKDGKVVETLQEGRPFSWGVITFDGVDSVYEVDLTSYQLSLQCDDLPSNGSSTKGFHAKVTYSCTVCDAGLIVSQNITNVSEFLIPQLRQIIRNTSHRYSVDERYNVERAIQNALIGESKDIAKDKGFAIDNIFAEITLNNPALEYQKSLEAIEDTKNQSTATHKLDTQVAQQQAELEKMKAEQQATIEKIKVEGEIEIMRTRVKFYEDMLKNGLNPLRLAQDPSAAERIRAEQINEEIIRFKAQLEAIVSANESGLIASPEAAEHAKQLLGSSIFNSSKPIATTSPPREIAQSIASESKIGNDDSSDDNKLTPLDDIKNP